MAYSACFFIQPRTTWPSVTPPTGPVPSHIDYSCLVDIRKGQSAEGSFSTKVPFSKVTQVCVKLTETSRGVGSLSLGTGMDVGAMKEKTLGLVPVTIWGPT